jgi:uncharacterized protein (TIGR03083 family)
MAPTAPTGPTAPTMDALADDLAAETAELRAMLAPLSEPDWRRATPAAGWSVLDQVSHLAHFDEAALRSATDPEGFRSVSSARVDPDAIAQRYRGRSGAEVLAWFDTTRAELVGVFRGLDRALRVPW